MGKDKLSDDEGGHEDTIDESLSTNSSSAVAP
jgi:hypothetical protein